MISHIHNYLFNLIQIHQNNHHLSSSQVDIQNICIQYEACILFDFKMQCGIIRKRGGNSLGAHQW